MVVLHGGMSQGREGWMIKTISLLHAKPGVSHAAFVDRYERVHVPLVNALLGPFAEYRRDYVDPRSSVFADVKAMTRAPDFDVMTVIRHADAAALDRLGEKLAAGDCRHRITEDEMAMFERRRMCMFAVDEHVIAASTGRHDAASMRLVLAGRLAEEAGRGEGLADCDDACWLLVERFAERGLTGLVRNYVPADGVFDLRHIDGHEGKIDFNLLLELEFAGLSEARHVVQELLAAPEFGRIFADAAASSGAITGFLVLRLESGASGHSALA